MSAERGAIAAEAAAAERADVLEYIEQRRRANADAAVRGRKSAVDVEIENRALGVLLDDLTACLHERDRARSGEVS